MFYVKLPRGAGRWTILEAAQVDMDSTWYELPEVLKPGQDEVAGLDVAAELRKRGVELRHHVEVLDVGALFDVGQAWHDPCVKVVHVLDANDPSSNWWSYIFQGDGYVMGENGGTIDKL